MGESFLSSVVGFFAKLPVSFNKVRIPLRIDTVKRNSATKHLATYGTLKNFHEKNVIQINDTHPALVVPELMRIFIDDTGELGRTRSDLEYEKSLTDSDFPVHR